MGQRLPGGASSQKELFVLMAKIVCRVLFGTKRIFVVCRLLSVALGKPFAEGILGFAECN